MTKLVHAEQNPSLEDEEVLGFLHTSFTSIIADKTPEDLEMGKLRNVD